MGEDIAKGGKKKELADIELDNLIEELLTKEEKETLEEELAEIEAKERMVFDRTERKFALYKKRVTDMKGNSRVIFPPQGKDIQRESTLEMVRLELMNEYKKYVAENCRKGGVNILTWV